MKLNAVLAVASAFVTSAAAAPAPQGKGVWIGGVYYDGHQPLPTYVDQNGNPVQVNKRSVFKPTGLPMKRRDDDSDFMNSVTATKTINSEALEIEISALAPLFDRRSPATAPAATTAMDADLRKRDWPSPAGLGKRSMTTVTVTQARPPGNTNSGLAVQYYTYDNGKRAVRDAMATPASLDSPVKRYVTQLDNGAWVDIDGGPDGQTMTLAGPDPELHPNGKADTGDQGQLVQRSWLHPTGLPPKRDLGDHAFTKGGDGLLKRSWLHPTGLPTKRDLEDEADTEDQDQLAQRSWLHSTGLPPKRDLGDHAFTKGGDGLLKRSWLHPTGLPTKRDLEDEADTEDQDQPVQRSWLHPTGLPTKRDEAGTEDQDQPVQRSWLHPTGLPTKRDEAGTEDQEQPVQRSWLHPTGLPTKRDLVEVEIDI